MFHVANWPVGAPVVVVYVHRNCSTDITPAPRVTGLRTAASVGGGGGKTPNVVCVTSGRVKSRPFVMLIVEATQLGEPPYGE